MFFLSLKKVAAACTALLFALFLATDITYAQQGNTVVDVVNSNDDLSTFADLLEETELSDLLEQQEATFTVIAPTNEAFENLGGTLDQLRQNPQELETFVIAHLYQGEVASDQIEPNMGVAVTDGDLEASNGVVHVVEQVVQ